MVRTAHDELQPVQSHLEEFATRGRRLLLALVFVSAIWSFFVDIILQAWLTTLPVATNEMTVYSPHRWLQLRWGLVALLGLLSISPLIGQQFLRFIRPGTLPRELTLAKFAVITAVMTIISSIPLLWLKILPASFGYAEKSAIYLTENAYDASLIFEVALGLSWFAVLFVLSCLVQFTARLTGTIGGPGDDSMRWKLHFVSLLALWIVLPPSLIDLWPTFAVVTFLGAEGFASLAPMRALRRPDIPTPRMAADGGVHRVALLDCACAGACPRVDAIEPIHAGSTEVRASTELDDGKAADSGGTLDGVQRLSCDALCLDGEAQDLLLEFLLMDRWTRLVIPGCDGSPVPSRLRAALIEQDCQLVGASWLDAPGFDETAGEAMRALWHGLSLDALVHPWSAELAAQAMDKRIESAGDATTGIEFVKREDGRRDWGEYLGPSKIVLPQIRTQRLTRGG